jgi:hypothetical protein
MNDTKFGLASTQSEELSSFDASADEDAKVAEEAGAEDQAEAANKSGAAA